MIDLSAMIPRQMHESLKWFGNLKDWCQYRTGVENGLPITECRYELEELRKLPGGEKHTRILSAHPQGVGALTACFVDGAGRLVADGPKLFCPTVEQFESMEHVELTIPPQDFRSPFPALVVRVPNECVKELIARFQVPGKFLPQNVLIFTARSQHAHVMLYSHFGDRQERTFIFSENELNPTIETALNRHCSEPMRVVHEGRVKMAQQLRKDTDGIDRAWSIIARSCLNLCIMLSHYGCKNDGPIYPTEYRKHRQRKELAHLAHGDFESIKMLQTITIRHTAPGANNPDGPGTGIEMRPHWRKGHWRAYPGQGEKRARGEQVQLLFVRPCIVRKDRIKGDISFSEVVYQG